MDQSGARKNENDQNSAACLLTEMGTKASVRLASSWRPSALLSLVLASISSLVLLLGHAAGVNGAVLIFTATGPEFTSEYTHVFGYLAEANFGLFSVVGLPLFLFLALSYARSCGEALAVLQQRVRKDIPSENLPCALAARLNRRIFRNFTGLALILLVVFLNVQWSAYRDARSLASLTETPTGTAQLSDWDFGLYQIPFLNGPERAFNGWDARTKLKLLKGRSYLDRLEANRKEVAPLAGTPAMAPASQASNPATRAVSIEEMVSNDTKTLTMSTKPTNPLPVAGLIYWLFFLCSQVLVVLSYLIAAWLAGKVFLWLWLLWFFLPQGTPQPRKWIGTLLTFLFPAIPLWWRACQSRAQTVGRSLELETKDQERLFGLGAAWPPVRWLFYAVALGTIYFSLQHPAPTLGAALSASVHGATTETLMVNLTLVLTGLGFGIGGQAFILWRAAKPYQPAKGQRVFPALVLGSKPIAFAILAILLASIGPPLLTHLPVSIQVKAAWPTAIRARLWKVTAQLYQLGPLHP